MFPTVYALTTLHGSWDVIVNGVRASTYTTAVAPGIAQALVGLVQAGLVASGVDVLGGARRDSARGGRQPPGGTAAQRCGGLQEVDSMTIKH